MNAEDAREGSERRELDTEIHDPSLVGIAQEYDEIKQQQTIDSEVSELNGVGQT